LLPGAPPAPGVEPAPSVAPQTEPAPAEPATLPAPQADATTPRLRPLQRVLFARNGHQLGRAELAALSALAAQATAGDTQIVIDGHADQTGPEAFNGWLSERRAMNVADHLVALGIPRDRIRVRHFGSARPAVDGDRPQAMRRNRRVEIALAEGDIP
ncbi:MAG TPA: OmpA family protein, partial [Polyangia bacterium]